MRGVIVSHSEGTSHPTVLPRASKRSDFVENIPVVTPVLSQDRQGTGTGLEHLVQPGHGDTERSPGITF